jgi:glycosyltransferase involved in cell wall biosynthesis
VNILFIGSYSDWHVDLWAKYFTKEHQVYLFSDKEEYLTNQAYHNITVIESEGVFGRILNLFKFKSHKWYQLNKLVSARVYAKQVDAVIDKYDIDIVHAHSLYYGYLASFIKGKATIVFTPMGSDIILHAQNNRLYQHMALNAFKKAHITTGDSLLLQKQGYKVGAKKDNNYIIQNGVDTSIFFPKENSIAKQYRVEQDEVLIFSPRGITPIYNIDIIVDALNLLIKKGYCIKCMFSFAFGDEYSDRIRRKIKEYGIEGNVIWLGCLSYIEMADHYNAADIIVSVPSSDSSPKSVYEAMLCKKPIVVSDLEWSYELLGDCSCLERVGVRDSDQLFASIEKIIIDPVYSQKLAKNSLLAAHKYFDYEKNMIQMEKIMTEGVYGK